MKQLFKSVMLFAAAATAFVSCSKDEMLDSTIQEESKTLNFSVAATIEGQTRAEFQGGNGGQLTWTVGDQMSVKYMDASNVEQTTALQYDETTGSFIQDPNSIASVAEGSEIKAYTPAGEMFAGVAPVQENSYNETVGFNIKNAPLQADPVVFDGATMMEGQTINLNFNFKHIASYMQVRLVSEDAAYIGKQIKSVKYVATTNISGVAGAEVGNSVQVVFNGNYPVIADRNAAKDLKNVAYLAVLPGSLQGSFLVETVEGTFFEIPVAKEFLRATVHRIALKLTKEREKIMFVRMTKDNYSQLLTEGRQFVMLRKNDNRYIANPEAGDDRPVVKNFAQQITEDLVAADQINGAKLFTFKQDGSNWILSGDEGNIFYDYNYYHIGLYDWAKFQFVPEIDAEGRMVMRYVSRNKVMSMDGSKGMLRDRNDGLAIDYYARSGAIVKEAAPTSVTVTPSTYEFNGEGGTATFEVATDVALPMGWSIEAQSTDPEFQCSMSADYKTLTVTVGKNVSGAVKNATISLNVMKGATVGVSGTLTVSQKQAVMPVELVTTPANGATNTFKQDAASDLTVGVQISGGDPAKAYSFKAEIVGKNADKFSKVENASGVVVSTIGANNDAADYEATLRITVLEDGVALTNMSEINLIQSKKSEGGQTSGLIPGVFQEVPANYQMKAGDKITFLYFDATKNVHTKRIKTIASQWCQCEDINLPADGTFPEAEAKVFFTADGASQVMYNGQYLNAYGNLVNTPAPATKWTINENSEMVSSGYVVSSQSIFTLTAFGKIGWYEPWAIFVCPAN